ncbi:hypothetical protein [Pelosinus sp. UFO1]|uniref:hypothetical protein n=1 Tax=Pelosinus sp. UFO1 TaxID=484770 RepID=UPI0004D1D697|nr:hypothetical protein [Pelosinus sp. UFO1]AIF54059.1 hypothetical protein UFO1_4524 [Pelosinus sp. UFO1]
MANTSNTNQNPQPIIDLILADINAIIPNFSSLVSSYRLLVGAAEEIHRTPEICPDIFERAVRRADNAGTIIDIFLELLCCKIAFSSEFLQISCAPVDLFRLLANRSTATDIPAHTAEQVVEMEALRRVLERCHPKSSCLPECNVVICPKPPSTEPTGPTGPPQPPPKTTPQPDYSDIVEVIGVALAQLIRSPSEELADATSQPRDQDKMDSAKTTIPDSRVRCKHLHKFR